jgi:hypothetical protein
MSINGAHAIDLRYARTIEARYLDPLDLVWYATARELGLTPIRRNPAIFSMTDGTGRLELAPRADLDPDDCVAQMIFHEICHWIVNGVDSFHERDWGFPLTDEIDVRELACQRLQAGLADRYGLRGMFGVTGVFRQYYDRIPSDVLEPLDQTETEAVACAEAKAALLRADGPPWAGPVSRALAATAEFRRIVRPFLAHYQTDVDDDDLPSLWTRGT